MPCWKLDGHMKDSSMRSTDDPCPVTKSNIIFLSNNNSAILFGMVDLVLQTIARFAKFLKFNLGTTL